MARCINENKTTFYRSRVTSESGIVSCYGPYSRSADAVDRGWWSSPDAVVEVQEQRPTADGLIEWVTIKTRG